MFPCGNHFKAEEPVMTTCRLLDGLCHALRDRVTMAGAFEVAMHTEEG